MRDNDGRGVYNSSNPADNESALNEFLREATVPGIDDETCKIFGRHRRRLRAAGKMTGDFDLLIGSIGIRHGLKVLTNNRRHFTLTEGLHIESLYALLSSAYPFQSVS